MSELIQLQPALEAVVKQQQFFRKRSIRRFSQLKQPRINNETTMILPENSVYHYIPESELEMGPPGDMYIARNAPRQVLIRHIEEFTRNEGASRKKSVQINALIQQFRVRHRMYRPLKNWEAQTRDPYNLVIVNYGMLSVQRIYQRTAYMRYHKWYNLFGTLIDTVADLLPNTDRQQFIRIPLPKVLPTMAQARRYMGSVSPELIKRVPEQSAWPILEILSWIMEPDAGDLLATIQPEDQDKVNFIFEYMGKWMLIKMSTLASFIKRDGDAKGLQPREMRIVFLNLLGELQRAYSAGIQFDDNEGENDEGEDDDDYLDEDEDEAAEDISTLTSELERTSGSEYDDSDDSSMEGPEILDDDVDTNTPVEDIEEDTGPQVSVRTTVQTAANDIESTADQLLDEGQITPAQHNRLIKLKEEFETIPNPFTGKGKLSESLTVAQEDVLISDNPTVSDQPEIMDKSMLNSTAGEFTEQYVEKVMNTDILNMVTAVQQGPFVVTDYRIESIKDDMRDQQIHTVSITPARGKSSTFSFMLPRVDKDGTFINNGVRLRLRNQRADLPIAKVGPNRVALSTYYSKVLIERSDKVKNDYGRWLGRELLAIATDQSNNLIVNPTIRDVFDESVNTPFIYSIIASYFSEFTIKGEMRLVFSYHDRGKLLGVGLDGAFGKRVEKNKRIIVGRELKGGARVITMDEGGVLYYTTDKDDEVIGTIEDLVGLNMAKAPLTCTEIKVGGKNIPLGFVLAYLYGWSNLLKVTKASYRKALSGERLGLTDAEYVVRFADETYVFERDDRINAMLFSGMNNYHAAIAMYSAIEFDRKDVYLNVIEHYKMGIRYLREFDLMDTMFVDPISKEILEQMKEPTNFRGLLRRANEMLKDEYVPKRLKGNQLITNTERIRGYERFSGYVYTELVNSMRRYNARSGSAHASLSMNPKSVYIQAVTDSGAEIVDDINPIHNLKEKEVLTFGGSGGRSGRTVGINDRLFTDEDVGFISEATVDSADVAVTTYMSPNANITTVRGTVASTGDPAKTKPSSMISTSMLFSPCADREDPKRANFINIQQSHVVPTEAYRTPPLRTGYEHAIAHRVDENFAVVAKQDGVITAVSKQHIEITYADKSVVRYPLGRTFANSKGSTYPRETTTVFKKGDKVTNGDVVTFEKGFFEPNPFNPKQVSWKTGLLAKVAICEGWFTFEDSSAISDSLADKLTTGVTEIRTITMRFDQGIRDLVKVGDEVDLDTPLCYIYEAYGDDSGVDDETITSLRKLSQTSPRAKNLGVVERVQIYYNGLLSNMSESLSKTVEDADRVRASNDKRMGRTPSTGLVTEGFRVNGDDLLEGSVAIRIYITTKSRSGVGHKVVFSNQLKSVIGHTYPDDVTTESGTPIDANFGSRSIQARIVLSAQIMGTTNTLLRVASKKVYERYKELTKGKSK